MLKEECHTQQIFFCYCLHYSKGSVLSFNYALFACAELFVTLVRLHIFSMKGELLYGLFDGLKYFLN